MLAARRSVVLFRRTHPTSAFSRTVPTPARSPGRQSNGTQPPSRPFRVSTPSPSTAATVTPSASSTGRGRTLATSAPTVQSALAVSEITDATLTTRSLSIGLGSGTLGAMCGIGGAVFAIPSLVRFASLPQQVAAGNALVAVGAVAATGAASFHAASAVDFAVAAPLALSAAACAPMGVRVAAAVADPAVLRRALGVFMLLLAPVLPLRDAMAHQRGLGATNADNEGARGVGLAAATDPVVDSTPAGVLAATTAYPQRTITLAVAGSAVGVTSGLLGVSGGSLFTPLIAAVCPDMPFRTVMGTSFAAMLIPTAIAAMSYARMRMLAPALLPALVIGAAIGARCGASVALSVPDHFLHYGFAAVFAIMGLRTLRAPLVRRATDAVSKGASKSGAGKPP